MFTYLWQCLAWLDPEVTQATVSPAIIMDNKKPSSVTQTGRRKSGGSTQLRSPIVKRPPMASVSLQGWLHKQGSEGLMLWKKRWFVLSEYCLFYYKGPEEEKLLGSILLPSYKVSPCTAEDKVFRKFAFKAEHANMRTYYFAAETRELMTQWMNALSLATILQEGTKLQSHVQPSVSSINSMLNQTGNNEDSDSGFQGYRSRSALITTQPTSQDGNMNGWAPPRNPYQPLYANAPPKPRRLNNEGQYGGSSPEASPDRREEMMYRRPGQQIGTPNRGIEYHYHPGQRVPHSSGYPTLPNPDVIRSIPNTGTYPGGMPVERRTPDPFGRSNINTPVRTPSRGGQRDDYSDVYKSDSYNTGGMYLRPEGPANFGYVKTTNPPIVNYQHPNQYYQGYHQLPQMSSAPQYQGLDTSSSNVISRRDRQQPPRPHSADFLDYDAKRYYQYQEYKETTIVEKTDVKIDEYPPARPPRPKSSLDIMHTNDGYYWSEESYAEKMRQSAMYLQNTLPQRSQSSRSNTPNFNVNRNTPKNDSVVMRQKTEGAKSPSRQNPRRWSEYNDRNGSQFVRSASARLPKNRQNDDESDEVQAYTGGEDFKDERKEESMKRLLEWKQRMLQSPLTRKPSGSSTRGASQNELSKYYKQQVLRELERQEAKSREELGKKRLKPDGLRLRSRSTDGRRSAMSSSNRYNSYSSDDEASASGSVMREAHLPRSMSTLSQGQQFQQRSASHQVTTPTIVLSKEESPTEKKINPHEASDRRLDEYSERIDYYDRGKGYPVPVNGYSDWNDSYSDRKNEYIGGREYVDGYLDRRRAPDNDYYIDQYQDHRIAGMYNNRNCGTLPMAKSTSSVPVPSISLQGSSLGRNMGTYDGRYSKESGKRARLAELETPKRMEHLQKLEELKKHLLDLEKQYEKGKPLVNLVDNMVKLGSLYRGNNNVYNGNAGGVDHSVNVREKLEFNQKVQEQRLLAEERRDWDRLSPDHNQLQAKVQQLYRLDRLLQEESGTLQSLQQDKELLEKALGGLRHKLQINRSNPVEADRYRKQQKLLEKELSRVRLLLAHNSKKLEETVAENARLEQELVILRQKLQASRVSSRSSVPMVSESATISTTAALEAELRRVQQLVGDLQRQRQELSAQVKQLTEKSDTLVQQIRPGPTGVAGAGPIPGKKKSSATWLETDLDLLVTQDVGLESPVTSPQHQPTTSVAISSRSTTPIYINTDINTSKKDTISSIDEQKSPADMTGIQTSPSASAPTSTISMTEPIMTYTTPVELSEADDRMKRFYGIIPREKQEIKTVRIVKRESERRQRDRDRSGNIGLPTTAIAKRVSVIEEDDGMLGRVEEESYETYSPNYNDEYQRQKMNGMNGGTQDPYMNFHPTNPFLPQNLGNINHLEELTSYEPEPLTSQSQRSMSLPRGFGKSPAPVVTSRDNTSSLRSMIAKRNRVRGSARSRDDLDMERALRPRINAPDVVRSTMNHKDLKYNENTIDNILGTPNKIVIPERYIPEQEPILTAEEQLQRLRKAESIRKMLSETSAISTPDLSGEGAEEQEKSSTLKKKVEEEKKQREHLLELNQILAQQVMEKSKLVAVKALATLPLEQREASFDEDDLSPIQPLPLYQQRENFYS